MYNNGIFSYNSVNYLIQFQTIVREKKNYNVNGDSQVLALDWNKPFTVLVIIIKFWIAANGIEQTGEKMCANSQNRGNSNSIHFEIFWAWFNKEKINLRHNIDGMNLYITSESWN